MNQVNNIDPVFEIRASDLNKVAAYLIERPFKEVTHLINILEKLKPQNMAGSIEPSPVPEAQAQDVK